MMPKEIYFVMLDKIQDQLKPSVENPYFISKLIKDSNSNDEIRSMQALMLLKYFKQETYYQRTYYHEKSIPST